MSNTNPTSTTKSVDTGKPPEAIILTGRFRSGTTLLWNIFRNLPQCCAYYEPANDVLPVYVYHNMPPSSSHVGVKSYWNEYFPIQDKLAKLHRPEFGVTRLLLEEDSEYPEFESYLRFLIESAHPKIPVLGFCRVDYRLPWLRRKFPGAKIVHIHRDPREQWYSMVRDISPGLWNDPVLNTPYDLVAWSCSLVAEFPFLTGDYINNGYQRHYLLWQLSRLMGERLSDVSINFDEELLPNPADCIASMLSTLGLTADVTPLAEIVKPVKKGEWKRYLQEDGLLAIEEDCNRHLKNLGLLNDFGKTPLSQIVSSNQRQWKPFSDDRAAKIATPHALLLFARAKAEGSNVCQTLDAQVSLARCLYNKTKGGVERIPKKAAEVKYLGQPNENRELAAEERAEGRIILETLPPITTFALTTFCNNVRPCLICDRNIRPSVSDFDTNAEVVRAMEPVIRTASVLLLHTGGEAMFSKYYDDVIDMVNPPTEVTFATNAMLMNNKRADRMLKRPIMCKIVVSLDAATSDIYRIHRPGSKFETVVDNVKYYIAQAKSLGQKKAQVELNMTVCKSNLQDVPKLVDLAVEVGASGISYQRLNSGLSFVLETVDGDTWDYKDQATFTNPAVVDQTILDTYCLAKQAGLEISYMGSFLKETATDPANKAIIKDLTGKIPFDEEGKFHDHPEEEGLARCLKRWEEVCVMPNGDVRSCYYHSMPKYIMGNVANQDFMSVWNSDAMIQERTMVVMNRWPKSCLDAPAICSHRGRI